MSRVFTAEQIARRNQTTREWKAKNAEYVRQAQKEWRLQNAAAITAQRKATYDADPEVARARSAAYRQENKDKVAAYMAGYRKKNIVQLTRSRAAWVEAHPERVSVSSHAQRVRAAGSTSPCDAELLDLCLEEAYRVARAREALTGAAWETDHIVPLRCSNAAVTGLHVPANLRVIPRATNKSKRARLIPGLAEARGVGAPL